jgi:hypothetical protein
VDLAAELGSTIKRELLEIMAVILPSKVMQAEALQLWHIKAQAVAVLQR